MVASQSMASPYESLADSAGNQMESLRCPETKARLKVISTEQLARINQAVTRGELRDQLGRRVESPLQAGLINEDGTRCYPVVDGVFQMLRDESIPLPRPSDLE